MADQKYVTAFIGEREIILDDSLKSLEREFGNGLLRIHRNCLVAPDNIEALVRDKEGHSHVRLKHSGALLSVSRRHLAEVKKALKDF